MRKPPFFGVTPIITTGKGIVKKPKVTRREVWEAVVEPGEVWYNI